MSLFFQNFCPRQKPHIYSASLSSLLAVSSSLYLHHPIISASLRSPLLFCISATSPPDATVSIVLVSLPLTAPVILSYHPQLRVIHFSVTGRCCILLHASAKRHICCPASLLYPSPPSRISAVAVSNFLSLRVSPAVLVHRYFLHPAYLPPPSLLLCISSASILSMSPHYFISAAVV